MKIKIEVESPTLGELKDGAKRVTTFAADAVRWVFALGVILGLIWLLFVALSY